MNSACAAWPWPVPALALGAGLEKLSGQMTVDQQAALALDARLTLALQAGQVAVGLHLAQLGLDHLEQAGLRNGVDRTDHTEVPGVRAVAGEHRDRCDGRDHHGWRAEPGLRTAHGRDR